MKRKDVEYEFEDIRSFFLARMWFGASLSDHYSYLPNAQEIEFLRDRTLCLPKSRARHIRSFISGYEVAKR